MFIKNLNSAGLYPAKGEDTTKSDNINLSGRLFSILNTQKRKPSGSMPADAPPHMASVRSAKPRNYLRKHVFNLHYS